MSVSNPGRWAQKMESGVYTPNHRPQFKMCDQQFMRYSDTKFQSSKKVRVSEMDSSLRMPLSSLNRSKQARHSEAELCKQFTRGKCYYGRNCKFAHDNGTRDGGKLLSNRGDVLGSEGHVMRSREKLCWWFINGRRCPYGDECVFPHKIAKEVEGNLAVHRENVAITLVDTRAGVENRSRRDGYCRGFQNLSYDAGQMQQKKMFWKTRLCYNWEKTGSCPYGVKCDFAHGEAEMQKFGSLPLQESGKAFTAETLANAAKGAASSKKGFRIAYEQLGNGKKRLLWWNNVEQVNGIYADWIDTKPPVFATSGN